MELTKEEISEGNSLISKFMRQGSDYENVVGLNFVWYITSWESLFEAIDKINSLGKGYSFAIFKTYVSLSVETGGKFYKDFSFAYSEYITPDQTGKEAAFKLIVRFIKWYNEQVLTQKLTQV